MKKAIAKPQSAMNRFMTACFLKVMVLVTIGLASASSATAQHCDGCSVNLMGPEVVKVGQTVTYTVMPTWPNQASRIWWDGFYNLSGFGTIVDQGRYASGEEWVSINFFNSGFTWVTFEAFYYPGYNYDELPIRIDP
jgi:hypothetical protein